MTNQETDFGETPLSEEAQVNELNRLAWNLRVTGSNQAFTLSSKAITLAQQIHYQQGLAEGLRTLGFCHIRLSRYTEAEATLRQSLRLFEALHHERGLSDVYEYFGIIHRSQGNYAASLDALFKSHQFRQQLQYKEGLALSFYHIGVTYKYLGDFGNALHYSLQGLPIAREIQAAMPESYLLNSLGGIYLETHDYEAALDYYNQSLTLRQRIGDQWGEAGCLDSIGTILLQQQKADTALPFFERGLVICTSIGDQKGQGNTLLHIGKIYQQAGQTDVALDYINQSLTIRKSIGDKKGEAEISLLLGGLYQHTRPDYALLLLQGSLQLAETIKASDLIYKIHQMLAETLKQTGDFRAALTHFELGLKLEKEVNSESVNQKLLNLQIAHQVEQARKEAELYQLRNQELAALVEEIQQQKNALNQTVQELRNTQAQLIQKEKLASLGELMAGIAHEIQNPLNFVNNFSEVSVELVEELKEEAQAGRTDGVLTIADDLTQNLRKITQHGHRASNIVKGMLEHSRASTGERHPTNLNALADEYLKLAYHGLSAKDKTFNTSLITNFAPDIGQVEVVPQDIGRVLLNLYNNAFYAIRQRAKAPGPNEGLYQPTVTVQTECIGEMIQIRVIDNGTGMPEAVKTKIFQPFFTTKPTGEGTGLGLSLAYDIITKGHGGTLTVESQQGEGTTFIVMLPA